MANRLCGNNANSVLSGRLATSGLLPPTNSSSGSSRQSAASETFTNTAKLPIDTVKRLIATVAARPNLWIRNHNGHTRDEIALLWDEVSREVHLPVDICRIKWGHLRDNFRKVFIRNKLSGETPTTWRFYNDMSFMEATVAENVMRQNRYRDRQLLDEEKLYQPSKELYTHPLASVPICEMRESFERDVQQFNFPFGFPELLNESQREHKRIKLESQQEFDIPFENERLYAEHKSAEHLSQLMSGYSHNPRSEPDADDDDDFDEDAATDENDQETGEMVERNPVNNGNLFTIEVFDDDEEEDRKSNILRKSRAETEESRDSKVSNSLKSATLEAATNTEVSSNQSQDQDPDRMFLLSLLPYLKNVDDKRKLHVRQKLQRVLIDELG